MDEIENNKIDSAYIKALLSNTTSFLSHVHWFKHDLQHPLGRSHKGISINHVDLQERREEFIRELKNTVCSWVYSKDKYNRIFSEAMQSRGGDVQNAAAHIASLAKEKFREGFPQGQFGELLLFNLIQHFFEAPPLLRKMPLTTNANIERHGADAIHYKLEGDIHKIILGEAKTYSSKYKFDVAFSDAIDSIFTTYENLGKEMRLYAYEDFIDENLKKIGTSYIEGTLNPLEIELVCIITYSETQSKDLDDEKKIKEKIEAIVSERFKNIKSSVLDTRDQRILKRMNYIVFPAWGLKDLLEGFDE